MTTTEKRTCQANKRNGERCSNKANVVRTTTWLDGETLNTYVCRRHAEPLYPALHNSIVTCELTDLEDSSRTYEQVMSRSEALRVRAEDAA